MGRSSGIVWVGPTYHQTPSIREPFPQVREVRWKEEAQEGLSPPLQALKRDDGATSQETWVGDFPGGTVVKNLPANAGDVSSIPALGRSHIPWSN